MTHAAPSPSENDDAPVRGGVVLAWPDDAAGLAGAGAPVVVSYGAHALPGWRFLLRQIAVGLRPRMRQLSSLFRRASLAGWRGPVDVPVGMGAKARLYPRENLTDKHLYAGAPLVGATERMMIESAMDAAREAERPFVFFDIGANVGAYVMLVSAMLAERGSCTRTIVAVEANPDMVVRLRANLAFSGISGVIVEPCALGARDGTVWLDTSNTNLGCAHVVEGAVPPRSGVAVPQRPLSVIVGASTVAAIDVLKIDIEGHEVAVLGPYLAEAVQKGWPRPALLIAEVIHDDGRLHTLLTEAGYARVAIDGKNGIYRLEAA